MEENESDKFDRWVKKFQKNFTILFVLSISRMRIFNDFHVSENIGLCRNLGLCHSSMQTFKGDAVHGPMIIFKHK